MNNKLGSFIYLSVPDNIAETLNEAVRSTTENLPDMSSLRASQLSSLPELHPPALMPRGNVGTTTRTFLRLIQRCKLPPSIISQLGLVFPRTRSNRRYGSVPLDYDTDIFYYLLDTEGDDISNDIDIGPEKSNHIDISPEKSNHIDMEPEKYTGCNLAVSGVSTVPLNTSIESNHSRADRYANALSQRDKFKSKLGSNFAQQFESARFNTQKTKETLNSNKQKQAQTKKNTQPKRKSKSKRNGDDVITGSSVDQPCPDDDDSDDCEEWDRYEALHDDVTAQERTKERLFEEDMEVVWEKGGSGLVWHTDARHWDQMEGGKYYRYSVAQEQ